VYGHPLLVQDITGIYVAVDLVDGVTRLEGALVELPDNALRPLKLGQDLVVDVDHPVLRHRENPLSYVRVPQRYSEVGICFGEQINRPLMIDGGGSLQEDTEPSCYGMQILDVQTAVHVVGKPGAHSHAVEDAEHPYLQGYVPILLLLVKDNTPTKVSAKS
jgi:hypothetical protein